VLVDFMLLCTVAFNPLGHGLTHADVHSAPDNLALNLANPPTHETNRSHGTSLPVVSGSCDL
jgi:hypothetical protein